MNEEQRQALVEAVSDLLYVDGFYGHEASERLAREIILIVAEILNAPERD